MSNTIRNSLTIAFGAAFLGSVSLSSAVSPSAAFQIKPLISGYMLAGEETKSAEGKCGEGKCGIPMMDKNKDGKVSKEESKAGGFSEKQFNAWDANHDGKLDKSELDAFHSVKGKEGYCS